MWKRKYSLKEQYGTLGHFLRGDEECHYIGQRYIENTNLFARREWRGVVDTGITFYHWLTSWIKMTGLAMKLPVRLIVALFKYRWFVGFLLTPAMFDRWIEGDRGIALRCDLAITDGMCTGTINMLVKTFRADKNLSLTGKANKYYDKLIPFDYSLPVHLIYGFPGYEAVNIQQLTSYIVPLLRKQNGAYYIDQSISCGIPADACNLLLTEVGVAVEHTFPDVGKFWVAANNPCDANIMGNAATYRHMSNEFDKTNFVLAAPMMYNDPSTVDLGVHEIEEAIKFIEEQTGQKIQWDPLIKHLESTNKLAQEELERWDIYAKTNSGCMSPAVQNLYRLFVYQQGGIKCFRKASAKALKYCQTAARKNIKAFPQARWRALAWSAEPVYYEGVGRWLYNCWGVLTVINMDSLTGHNMFETGDTAEIIRDLADCHARTIMRTHVVGGDRHLMQMWETAEKFNCNFIVMYDDVCCKGMASATGLIEEEIAKHSDKFHVMWVPHSLMDYRTIPPAEIRSKVNQYMTSVMNAEPLDPSLVDYDDSLGW